MTDSHQQSWVADEVAAALHVAPRTASMRVHAGAALVRDWPILGEQVSTGRLTVAQARTIYEGVSVLSGVLDDGGRDLSERAVHDALRFAPSLPPARLRERVARLVSSLDAEGAARRRQRAARELTDVALWAEADGMACVAARGPAADALAVREAIDARARQLREGAPENDDRTIGQWRHAAFLAAFGLSPVATTTPALSDELAPTAPTGKADVQVRVTVPLTTLLELTDIPGELEGYGPLDADLCRVLAADADWVRWVTDPVGDYLIDEGRRRYPGARLGRFLRSREPRCKHPSCGVRSANADADHLPAYADGGRSSAASMSPTCPRHNRSRAASGWQVSEEGPRDPLGPPDPVWTSPLGRRYRTQVAQALPVDHVPLRT